jgi:hypothetical protein
LAATTFGFAQDIEIIHPKGGVKELDLTKPKFTTQPEPIPAENGTYRFTHYMGVFCETGQTGESGELIQYLNVSNGVVGVFPEDLAKWMPDAGNQAEGKMDFWAILPSMTQRMYLKAPDVGKVVMQMSADDPHSNGSYTTQMARFDAANQGEIFWLNAKKHKTVTLPAHLLENNRTPLTLDVYNYQSEEGPVQILMKDLGPAEGKFAPLKKIYAATGMGGLGYALNPLNNRVYLLFSITKDKGAVGCRLFTLQPKVKTFSGAGYKPIGDMVADAMKSSKNERNLNYEQDLAETLAEEEDTQIRGLLKEKADLQRKITNQHSDQVTGGAMLNDMTEMNRATLNAVMDVESNYQLNDVELRIQLRRRQIELSNDPSPEQRTQLNKQVNCLNKQRQLWANHRTDALKLKEKIKNLEQYEQLEKMGALMADYQQRAVRLCP